MQKKWKRKKRLPQVWAKRQAEVSELTQVLVSPHHPQPFCEVQTAQEV